jgi:hypothetical protein
MTYSSEWERNRALVAEVIASFPATFGLRAFPGLTFRLNTLGSYVSPDLGVQLVTQVERDGKWLDFARGTPDELRQNMVIR